ncbi:putative coatomer subunit beta' [Ceratocystis platani]|uniref:Beta'-coat protein n=1 Tax=Ceratocystis fimbriata f. sp. platani TaxID=88771 RepID=A0A0F8DK17_CERFI|nr:putative coatomer subunit beta' [Ceratocystis platani]
MDPFLPHNSSSNVQQVAPYSRGAPSPPYINLSGIHRRQKDEEQLEYPVLYFAPHMLPIIGPDSLSEDLVAAAIGIKFTTEKQSSQEWRWNMRHEAQPITDSLLVGPSLVARSKDFLVDAGITMAITVIDPRLIPWQATMRKTVMDAGIEMHVIPAESATEILHSLGDTINMINQHLVSVFCQRVRAAGFSVDDVVRDAAAAYSSGDPKEICAMDAQLATLRGKVLLTCESGNSRSVTVAVAYLMAITGEQMHVVVQFVCTQRFCSIFEEEHKRVLLTWNDILTAKLERQLFARSDRVKGVDFHPTEPWILCTLYSGHVSIWSYETQQVVKTFELTDVPVRCGRFVARKNWIVCGSDDFQIRVYNYNTSEKVAQFEAHPDYLRSIAVHPTQPFILTSSDDMTIKLWDWEKGWKCVQVFEGHAHYVMSIAINPKDTNTFATACLDRTVKIWSLGSPHANFTLEAHETKGVNYVDYCT